MRCPGMDTHFWGPNDIFDVRCPACGTKIEFFKDDGQRRCPGCNEVYVNPKLETNCFKYCKFGAQCEEYLKFK